MGAFRKHEHILAVFIFGLALSAALIILFVLRVQFFGNSLDPPLAALAAVWACYWAAAILWVGDCPYRLRLHLKVWVQRRARARGTSQAFDARPISPGR